LTSKQTKIDLIDLSTDAVNDDCLHMSCNEFELEFNGTKTQASILDDVSTNFNFDENNDTKVKWCTEFMIGYTRLRQFLHVTIYNTYRVNDHANFLSYLKGEENMSDAQMENGNDVIIGGVQQFTTKMQIVTFGLVFSDKMTQDDTLCTSLATINRQSNNSVGDWATTRRSLLQNQKNLQNMITTVKNLKNKKSRSDEKQKEMDILSVYVRELESNFKTNNAYILYETYFSFRKKNLSYNEMKVRPAAYLEDEGNLYDDTDGSESSEEDSDDE